ncbi:MAG: hypothetical protein EZS28_032852 [Streblomastix strix]|uniref:Uncharacterized protein n=1 Tax=Streblomastix strix TaxID=222440 RepID=A0A5J4UNR6_9EUKA|nr:MAG: hypothetical protein EZS28_032852 [Streblomastix strix]
MIQTPFKPPTPALFVVNSCNYTATFQLIQDLLRNIEEVPEVVRNIGREKRDLIHFDGSFFPFDMFILAAGLQDQTLKRLSQFIAEKVFHENVTDGTITMNDETDVIRLQRAGTKCLVTEECEEVIIEPTDRRCFRIDIYQPDFFTSTSAINPDKLFGCKCDENEDATFNLDDCIETKTCTGNNTPIGCSCADNGSIQTLECKCPKLHHPDGCTPVECLDKYYKFTCLCTQKHLKDTDECICPSNGHESLPCVCSTTLESNPQDCTINDCLANSDTIVPKFSCYCTKDNYYAKCRCLSLPEDLQDIPVEQCQYLVDNDPREGGACLIPRLCQFDDDLSTSFL